MIKLKDKHLWLKNLENENIIIHSDFDGIISMAFLQHYAKLKKIVGIYDLNTFYMKEKKYLKKDVFKDIIGIDLDISYFNIRGLGHHLTCLSNDNCFNINEYYNVKNNPIKNYYKKYPLNTIILLYSIFNIKPKTDEEIALLVYADSVFKNFKEYEYNVTNWLKLLNQYEILNALNNRYDKIKKIIDTKIAPVTSTYKDNRVSSTYSQCPLTTKYIINNKTYYQYDKNSKPLLELIYKYTTWNIIDLPETFPYQRICNNIKIDLSNKKQKDISNEELLINFNKLSKLLLDNNDMIVSNSMTYKSSIKITLNNNNNIIFKDNKYCIV